VAKAVRSTRRAVRPAPPVSRRVPPTIRLQLAGSPRLAPGNGHVHELERHEAALLALIALDGPTPRGQAAALLWGDADTDRQRSSLRQRLFQLRRRSGCHVIPAGEVLTLAPGIEHDLAAIEIHLREACEIMRVAEESRVRRHAAEIIRALVVHLPANEAAASWVNLRRRDARDERRS